MYASIARAVAAILAGDKVVSSVDVIVRMGWLSTDDLEAWRFGRVPYLEGMIRCNLTRLSRFLRILGFHCHALNLTASHTGCDASLEQVYARHFVWPGKRPFHPPRPPDDREG